MALDTNMLFSLNGKDFLSSYGKLEESYKYFRGTVQTMAHWSATSGGGRFTKLISLDFISQLKKWMIQEKFKSSEPYNEYYGRMKKDLDSRFWMLRGNVYKNISIIYRGKHTQTVGIRRDIMVPRIGIDGKAYGTISIAVYAMINEFGGKNVKARPLFQPAMLEFIQHHFPPMAKMVKKAIIIAAKKEEERVIQRTSAKGDISNVISQASLGDIDKVANKNIDRDFSQDVFEGGLSITGGSSIGQTTKALNKSGARMSKRVSKEMVAFAKSKGMSISELQEFLSTGE